MTEHLRDVFAAALPATEPPLTTDVGELAATGRRRRRRRRVGLAVSGATFGVAALTAMALLLPGAAPGPSEDAGTRTDAEPSLPSSDPAELSEQVRDTFAAVYPGVEFEPNHDFSMSDVPFDLGETGPKGGEHLRGEALAGGELPELVDVRLYPPGDWSTEPGTDFDGGDPEADEYLVDCGSQPEDSGEFVSKCDSRELDDGTLLRIAELTQRSHDGSTTSRGLLLVAYRADDTAVLLSSACVDPEGGCADYEFKVGRQEAMERFLVEAPKIPRKL